MARQAAKPKARRKPARRGPIGRAWRWLLRWGLRSGAAVVVLLLALIVLYRFVPPPTTHTIWAESRRLGGVERQWLSIDAVAPVMLRSAVAAEDANFCLHWGFDVDAIRTALEAGGQRGASTLSQQVVKNVFLWQGRSWIRKALEATITPLAEMLWTKRHILELYLNLAEFGEGVFGIDAAAHHYYGVSPRELTAAQAARLAVVLPNPKVRDPNRLSPALQRRAAQVRAGADTILADGRASCFES